MVANRAEHDARHVQGRRELHEFAAHQNGSHCNGYVEGIALDMNGYVSEASGANIFVVRKGKLLTPPLGNSVLPGITRESIITLGDDIGLPVVEQMIPREMLYLADEVFFCGTASEITPIRAIDKININNGITGPVTLALQREFFGIVNGTAPDRHNWFTPVPVRDRSKQPVGCNSNQQLAISKRRTGNWARPLRSEALHYAKTGCTKAA